MVIEQGYDICVRNFVSYFLNLFLRVSCFSILLLNDVFNHGVEEKLCLITISFAAQFLLSIRTNSSGWIALIGWLLVSSLDYFDLVLLAAGN